MIPALDAALLTRLGGTATAAGTAVFSPGAPAGQSLPYIVWSYVNDGEENKTPNRGKNELVFVRGYASTKAAAGTIDGQIETLLHDKPLTISGYANLLIERESAYSLTETDISGRETFMAGAEYRILLDKS